MTVPLGDITNTALPSSFSSKVSETVNANSTLTSSSSSCSSSSSSRLSSTRRISSRPRVLRQTNLPFFTPSTSSPLTTNEHSCSLRVLLDESVACEGSSSSSSSSPLTAPTSSFHECDNVPSSSPLASRHHVMVQDRMEVDDEVQDEEEEKEDDAYRSRKRARSEQAEALHESWTPVATFDRNQGRKMESVYTTPGKTMSAYEMMKRRALGLNVGMKQVSLEPMLRNFVSSNENQVIRCPSVHAHRNFAPPFAVKYSHEAKRGGKQTLAIADEEGQITFLDGDRQSQWDMDPSRTSFQAHANAIFDIAWGHDDALMATASGDQLGRVFDVETQTCIGELAGHSGTIKNIVWNQNDPNILSTAARDGSIRIWDRRASSTNNSVQCVNVIKNAHGSSKKTARSSSKSVTAVAFLPQSEHLLASSGSFDSIIKVWDLRKSHSRRVNPASVESNECAILDNHRESTRPHGISSLVLAPDGRGLYSLGTDSIITKYDPLNLSRPQVLSTYTHPSLSCNSFYIRVSISPNSRFILCGSSDASIHLFDSESSSGSNGIVVKGHEKEISGLDWGNQGKSFVSCSDDLLVRTWSLDQRVAERRRSEREEDREIGWRWSGSD